MTLTLGRVAAGDVIPLLLDASGRPLVTIDTALPAGSNLIGRVDGKLGNVLHGMTASFSETVTRAAVAGTDTVVGSTVAAGTGRLITTIMASNLARNLARVERVAVVNGVGMTVQDGPTTTANWTPFNGLIYLEPGDWVQINFYGNTVGDTLAYRACGYTFNL